MARLAPLADDELPADARAYWATIAEGMPDGAVPGLYRLLAHNPALVGPVHQFARTLFVDAGLDPVVRQLVIHRTVLLERCSHAWKQHLLVSRSVGVDPELIQQVGRWRAACCYTAEQAAALAATDEIVRQVDPGPAIAPLAPDQLVAVRMLAGFYVMIARFLNSCGLHVTDVTWPPEEES